MSATEVEEIINASPLPETRRREVREADDKLRAYAEAMFWVDLAAARNAQSDLHNYVVQNWIFMTDPLREAFTAIDKKVRDALVELEIWHEAPPGERGKRLDSFKSLRELETSILEVGTLVQKRLHYEEA